MVDETPQSSLEQVAEYFNEKDVIKSEETAKLFEQGHHVAIDDLVHLVEAHCSPEAVKKQDNLEAELDNEMLAMYKNAFMQKGEMDKDRLNKLSEYRVKLQKRELRRELIAKETGEESSSGARVEAVKNHSHAITESLKHIDNFSKAIEEVEKARVAKLNQDLTNALNNISKDDSLELKLHIFEAALKSTMHNNSNEVNMQINKLKNKFELFLHKNSNNRRSNKPFLGSASTHVGRVH